ncbi:transglycosylase SLT domain-containing protein [Thiotrichales bacterium 19S3-7]|nr:transglycosylase SLT domain-containing protein [Thiotrichales bacterium 19S3-7]MCF6801423.1 transglycosylase SLT domain-containing protein [Thiotrichales bacterium 19S3-11]
MGSFRIFVTIIFLISWLFCQVGFSQTQLTNSQYQKLFNEARSHINDLDLAKYYQLKAKLKNYSLYPYLQYLELINHFDDYKPQTVENYLNVNQDSFWAMLLKPQWLNYLGENEIWDIYLKVGSNTGSLTHRCWYARALYEQKQKTKALKTFSSIWLYGHSLPEACDFMLIRWQKSKYDTESLRIERIKLAMAEGEYDLARYLSYQLDKSDQKFIQAWVDAEVDPNFSIKPLMDNYAKHQDYQYALLQAFDVFANEDLSGAIKVFEKYQKQIPQPIVDKIRADIAMELAREHSPIALDWLKKVPDDEAVSLVWQWRARTAILWQKWPDLVNWIKKMPKALQEKPQWQYWLAVGLYYTKDKKKADTIWHKLAQKRSYYGFLSADQIGASYNLKTKSHQVSKDLQEKVQKMPEIQQVYQLYQLGELKLADYYWRWTLNRFNRYQALAAAIIANDWGIDSMSIYAYGRSGYIDDLTHRFPLAYKKDILKYSKEYKLNPGWVWALTRQESYFHPEAVSSAGARGLMQLMPSTASFIASRYKIPYDGAQSLFIPHVNIELGIANLSHVYDYFNRNMVLATSAYNAGFGNTKNWLPKNSIKAQRWVEIVPFLETRNYIRHVLAFTIIYDNVLLNKAIRLQDIMKEVQS